MAKFHARNASIYVDSAAGASTAISADLNSLSLETEAEAPEVTGFGDNTVQRLSDGVKDVTVSLEGFYNQGATGAACILYALLAGSTFVQIGPNSSTSGSLKYTASMVMTNLSFEWGVGDAATFSAEFASRSGSLTASAW